MDSLVILAHQGGWDEIALVGGPIIVFAGLLLVARRRALQHAANLVEPAEPADD